METKNKFEICNVEDVTPENVKKYFDTKTADDMKRITNELKSGKDIADIYAAELISGIIRRCVRFNSTNKTFSVYNGVVWIHNSDEVVQAIVPAFGKGIVAYATAHWKEFSEEEVKNMFAAGKKISNFRKYSQPIFSDLKNRSELLVTMDDFDKEKTLFNVMNGTYDLKSDKMLEHNPDDMITRVAPVTYDPTARATRFEKFLEEVMVDKDGNVVLEDIKYLKQFFGLILDPTIKSATFHMFYGATTRNGKSTLCNALMSVLGEQASVTAIPGYAERLTPTALDEKKKADSGNATPELAKLEGARLVVVDEPSRSMVLDGSKIKIMTGGCKMPVRMPFGQLFSMDPSNFRIILDTNYKPAINDPTLFASGRVRVVPFEKHFEAFEQDDSLGDTLRSETEKSGILNIMIEGHRAFLSEHEAVLDLRSKGVEAEAFPVTERMKAQVTEYEEDADRLGAFLDEVLVKKDNEDVSERLNYDDKWELLGYVSLGELYRHVYRNWCKAQNYKGTLGRNKFITAVSERFEGEGFYAQKFLKTAHITTNKKCILLGWELSEEGKEYEYQNFN